jgi:RHS repeat-associated protein
VVAVQTLGNAMGLRVFAYKSASGRLKWLNRDPIGENGGLNLYDYVANDPVNLFDPFGLRPPTGTQGGYVDQFGNWHMSFCMSCHDNTPAGNFLMSQSMAANNQSWGVFAYQQGLGLGLGLGLGGIANDMSLDAMMEAEQASQLAQMGKGIVCNGKVVAHAPLEAVTSHEQLAMQSGTLLQAPQAGTPGSLVPGAEAFTYSAQGPNVFVTGSMNFNSNVSENTVQVVTFYLNRK